MSNHENYTGYKPQPPIGRSGGLSVETFVHDPEVAPRTIVESPLHQMQPMPAVMKPVRPVKQIHPYFVVSDPEAGGEGVASYDAPGGSALGKAVAAFAETADPDDFSPAEQAHLIALMDSEPGQIEGYTNLDVWD
jgi:hypothetical protein